MAAVDDARQMRQALFAMTARLVADFRHVPSSRVLTTVAVCRSELARAGTAGCHGLDAIEALTRARLGTFRVIPRYCRDDDDPR